VFCTVQFTVFCTVQFTVPAFLFFSFRGISDFRKQKMVKLLSMDHHRGSVIDRWAIHGTVHSVTDCKYCTNSYGCYLNVNDSAPVSVSCSIIMCK